MRAIHYGKAFEKSLKRMLRRGKNAEDIKKVIVALANGQPLDRKYKDHALVGDFAGFRDCHIEPDWLLIYRIRDDAVFLEKTGTHSDLFG